MEIQSLHRWTEVAVGELQCFEFCGGSLCGFSQKSPDKDTENEDAALVIELSDDKGLLLVADGVGGERGGAKAARACIDAVAEHIESAKSSTDTRVIILDAIESANQTILGWGHGAMSTLTIVEVNAKRMRTYHAGDTQALLLSNRGNVKFLTPSHAPIAQAVTLGFLEERDGLLHEDRNIISNCVGSREMRIEISSFLSIAQEDTLIVASDALYDNLTLDEIVEHARLGPVKDKSSFLADAVLGRMVSTESLLAKPDDFTFLCCKQ